MRLHSVTLLEGGEGGEHPPRHGAISPEERGRFVADSTEGGGRFEGQASRLQPQAQCVTDCHAARGLGNETPSAGRAGWGTTGGVRDVLGKSL